MWTLWLHDATVRSFAHMPLGIFDRSSSNLNICFGFASTDYTHDGSVIWALSCTFSKKKPLQWIQYAVQIAIEMLKLSRF